MYPAKYACHLFYVLALKTYPVEQWFHLMWSDQNPYIDNRHCNFCNEMFYLGEKLTCSPQCLQRHREYPHFFHIACLDILMANYNQEIAPIESKMGQLDIQLKQIQQEQDE